jgi:hypothetical protein
MIPGWSGATLCLSPVSSATLWSCGWGALLTFVFVLVLIVPARMVISLGGGFGGGVWAMP